MYVCMRGIYISCPYSIKPLLKNHKDTLILIDILAGLFEGTVQYNNDNIGVSGCMGHVLYRHYKTFNNISFW